MYPIPAIDLLDSKIVRLEQGNFDKVTIYYDTPIDLLLELEEANIQNIHIVDLSGSKQGKPYKPHLDIIQNIKRKTSFRIQTGGGIRSLEQVDALFDVGLKPQEDYVMLGSLPFKNIDEFEKIVEKYADSILLTIDVKGHTIQISGWQEDTKEQLFSFLSQMLEYNISNFLVTQINKDGMLVGPDIDIYSQLLKQFPNIRLIASGGIGKVDDLYDLQKVSNLFGCVVGKAYYEKRISLEQIEKFYL